MVTKIGINGFGRVGRQALKAILEHHPTELEVVAINDLADTATNALLLKYDSNYGHFPREVGVEDGALVVNGKRIAVFSESDPAKIPWASCGVEIVLEATGRFTEAAKARAHLLGGARRVIIAAPGKQEDVTIVLGVNEGVYDPARHVIISNASCTTNGLAPVARVLNDRWGIEKGLLTTVHAYTNSQKLLDVVAKDPRDARAAGLNIVPSSTGAARAVGLVIPELKGRFGGMAFRVPTPTVSVVDFTADLRAPVTVEKVNAAFKEASEGSLKGILAYTDEPLVSMDLKGDAHSTIVSGPDTLVVGETMVKVVAWYDNEWGYACRLGDLAAFIAAKETATRKEYAAAR
jgi:glyceraldehyde 3-phosphate dehydrogenase